MPPRGYAFLPATNERSGRGCRVPETVRRFEREVCYRGRVLLMRCL